MNSAFENKLNGMLYSLLSWDQLAAFWTRLDTDAAWYLYAVGEAVPTQPASSEQVKTFVREIDLLLRRDHDESYCGIVYADDVNQPTFVKIYDPNNLGVSCGSSKVAILPGWVMSQVPPVDLKPLVVPAGRKRWWQSLVGAQ